MTTQPHVIIAPKKRIFCASLKPARGSQLHNHFKIMMTDEANNINKLGEREKWQDYYKLKKDKWRFLLKGDKKYPIFFLYQNTQLIIIEINQTIWLLNALYFIRFIPNIVYWSKRYSYINHGLYSNKPFHGINSYEIPIITKNLFLLARHTIKKSNDGSNGMRRTNFRRKQSYFLVWSESSFYNYRMLVKCTNFMLN